MIHETKSKWDEVADLAKDVQPIQHGRYVSYWYHRSPRRMLHSLSYYKFAAKMIGKGKRVFDFGCNEGLGTYVLAKECGYAKGIDLDAEAIACAKRNYAGPEIDFSVEDILQSSQTESYDAIVNFDVIEHIDPEKVPFFWKAMQKKIKPTGIVVIGTPSEISQQFASEIAKSGHVNIYSPKRLNDEMEKYFKLVFLFAANDEVVHTGFLPLAHYLIVVGCGTEES